MKNKSIKSFLTALVCFISINVCGQALSEQEYSEMASIFAEDVQLFGDSRDDYNHYQATHPYEPFSSSTVFTLNKSQHTNRNINKILVIATSTMYNQLAVKINRYATDINDVYGCEVIVETVSGGNHINIKNLILSHQTNLSGVVFIGDIAPAWFEIDNVYHNGYAVWPCDLYYMDLNGIWADTDGNGIFDSHTGNIKPEIFVGRISTKNMGTLISEVAGLDRYLDKNHNFWIGNITVNAKYGLCYADMIGDGTGIGELIYLYGISNTDIVVYGHPGYGKADYLNRLNNPRYEFVHVICHATPTTLAMPGGSIYSNEIYYNESVAFGYLLTACSACNWTAANSNSFLGGAHVYNAGNSSLVAVGYTKICSGFNLPIFFSQLGMGKTVGESLKQWGINMLYNGANSEYYGITIIGDPLINFYYNEEVPQPMTWEIGNPVPSNVIAHFENETLTITGTGATQDFPTFQDQPWASVRNSIKNLIIHSGVTSIGNRSFMGCGVLSVNIPSSVTKLGNYAFSDCSSLTSAFLPITINDIGIRAFQNCSSLADFYVKWNFPYFISESAFYGVTTSNVNLHVPCGKGSLYANASVWQNFNIIDTNIQTITFAPLAPKTYGDGSFTLIATSNSSLPIVFQSSNTNVATVSGNILTILNAGTTTITATQNGNDCYNAATPVSQILTVNKANLIITAEDKTRPYGEANPPFTLTYLGFVNGDDINSLTTQPVATCDATPTSDVGDYTIFVSGGVSSNYNLIYQYGTLAITQATQAAPPAPTLNSKTSTSITLNTVPGCEYNINGDAWQSSPIFAGLTPNTSYTFTQRKAETDNYFASPSSPPATFTTEAEQLPALIGTVIIQGNAVFGQTLTAVPNLSSNPPGDLGAITYQWKRSGTPVGTNSVTYILTQADISHTMVVTVTATNCSGSVSSNPTAVVTKAAQAAPQAPTLNSKTTTSITLNVVSGCEYNINGGAWQLSPIFAGLTPNTSYIFTQRKAETATHLASPASPAATFTTDNSILPLYAIVSSVNNPTFGTITPYGENTIEEGGSIEFTITSYSGYRIDSVMIDGVNYGAIETYTFQNIHKNGTIKALFGNNVVIDEIALSKIRVYPNPTTGELQIISSANKKTT